VWDEESGELHPQLKDSWGAAVSNLASFLSPDGQSVRLVVGSPHGELRIYDPEAGSLLHRLKAHSNSIWDVACIVSSSAAPHHPRLVSVSTDGTAKVWDGEIGEMLADLRGHRGWVMSVAVWKEHMGEHDRIATAERRGVVKVWDGEALTLLRDLEVGSAARRIIPFESAEGPIRLLVVLDDGRGIQIWDPEEGRLLHDGIHRDSSVRDVHLFTSAEGRYLLAIRGGHTRHIRHPGDTARPFLDVWDLGEAPARERHVWGAHKQG
jgi:hypothetical protein